MRERRLYMEYILNTVYVRGTVLSIFSSIDRLLHKPIRLYDVDHKLYVFTVVCEVLDLRLDPLFFFS